MIPSKQLTLEDLYERVVSTPSDIFQHCGRLRALSSQCDVVVELGMRHGVSTVALLAGQPRRLISVDVNPDPITDQLKCVSGATQFEFRCESSLIIELPDCDLLFIDTYHTSRQLHLEMQRHAGRVGRWMVLHDTEAFGELGEDGREGLLFAIEAFLEESSEWQVVYHSKRNNGFTVIAREPFKDLPLTGSDPIPARIGKNK